MTGRILALATASTDGWIKAENGSRALFHASEVELDGPKSLAVGQLITFELSEGEPPVAFNIFVEKQHYSPNGTEKRPQSVRYLGFAQTGNTREYKFENTPPGEEASTVVIDVDLPLFAKHHVGIQDGPVLCLHFLTASEWPPARRSLNDRDMLAHLALRPAPRKFSSGHKGRRPPKASSNPARFSSWSTRPQKVS
jgi:cold shock CspA family protein